MNNYKKLIEKYPLLFEGLGEQEPFSHFGFECDIGWYNIIRNACHLFYSEYKSYKRQLDYIQGCLDDFYKYLTIRRSYDKVTPEQDIINELVVSRDSYHSLASKSLEEMPKLAQVKEKYGTLRIYVNNTSYRTSAIVDYAELMSEVTCEVCGNAGRTYEMGWHKTLCKEHAIQRYGLEKVEKYENKD